jgi:hypothetical protein
MTFYFVFYRKEFKSESIIKHARRTIHPDYFCDGHFYYYGFAYNINEKFYNEKWLTEKGTKIIYSCVDRGSFICFEKKTNDFVNKFVLENCDYFRKFKTNNSRARNYMIASEPRKPEKIENRFRDLLAHALNNFFENLVAMEQDGYIGFKRIPKGREQIDREYVKMCGELVSVEENVAFLSADQKDDPDYVCRRVDKKRDAEKIPMRQIDTPRNKKRKVEYDFELSDTSIEFSPPSEIVQDLNVVDEKSTDYDYGDTDDSIEQQDADIGCDFLDVLKDGQCESNDDEEYEDESDGDEEYNKESCNHDIQEYCETNDQESYDDDDYKYGEYLNFSYDDEPEFI